MNPARRTPISHHRERSFEYNVLHIYVHTMVGQGWVFFHKNRESDSNFKQRLYLPNI